MTSTLVDTPCAVLRSSPAGDVELEPGDGVAAYGLVEIAWYPERLRITALGAGPGSLMDAYLSGEAAQDIVLEIRLPDLDELTETVPGAD